MNHAADATPTFKEDVEGTETFAYDAIGNWTHRSLDNGRMEEHLEWNAYGKVRQVTTSNATMTFGYGLGMMHNRIA